MKKKLVIIYTIIGIVFFGLYLTWNASLNSPITEEELQKATEIEFFRDIKNTYGIEEQQRLILRLKEAKRQAREMEEK